MYILTVYTMTTIQKWGNSLGVRLPKQLAREFRLMPGSAVLLREEHGRISITPTPTRMRAAKKEHWAQFLIPTKRKKKENVSGKIDALLYG